MYDDKRTVTFSRGSEYNTLVVGKDGEVKESSTPNTARSDGDSSRPLSTTSGAARRKKKKAAAAASASNSKEEDAGGDDEPDASESGSAAGAPAASTSTSGWSSKRFAEELAKKEQEWREAWILNELRSNQLREQEKIAMRQTWANERTQWLLRIKQFGTEAKELRQQTLELQAKLDAAVSGASLSSKDVERSEGRSQQENVYVCVCWWQQQGKAGQEAGVASLSWSVVWPCVQVFAGGNCTHEEACG
jgi:hypothetical protein